jgi:[ribosomal protein S18]-alanine N-acetyltransferase
VSAVPNETRHLLPMSVAQLDAVLAVEATAYAFPWSRGNFIDSLAAGYPARVLYADRGEVLGYFVAMPGVDEMHLLNITVAPPVEGLGHARFMLGELVRLCREFGARQLWLEVRESNARARSIYQRFGFLPVGVRKGYYPAPHGQREAAIVMSLPLAGHGAEAGDALV